MHEVGCRMAGCARLLRSEADSVQHFCRASGQRVPEPVATVGHKRGRGPLATSPAAENTENEHFVRPSSDGPAETVSEGLKGREPCWIVGGRAPSNDGATNGRGGFRPLCPDDGPLSLLRFAAAEEGPFPLRSDATGQGPDLRKIRSGPCPAAFSARSTFYAPFEHERRRQSSVVWGDQDVAAICLIVFNFLLCSAQKRHP